MPSWGCFIPFHPGSWKSPKLQDLPMFHFLLGFVAGCPSGKGFLVNGHDVDARRNYSFPSTRHTSIDNTTVGKLEHDIAGLKPWLSLLHDAYKAQTGLGEGVVFIECEHRHEERSWGEGA